MRLRETNHAQRIVERALSRCARKLIDPEDARRNTLAEEAIRNQARQTVGVVNRRPQLKLIASSASPEEAAAVVAAVERFMRATAPALATPKEGLDPWRQAAILEGVSREHRGDVPDPWINT